VPFAFQELERPPAKDLEITESQPLVSGVAAFCGSFKEVTKVFGDPRK
jgi:hypothetical protein